MLALAGCSIVPGSHTVEPVATPTAVTWPKKITFEATSLRRDKSLITAFTPPGYMLGDEPLVVSTYESWQSEPYIMTGPGFVGMSTLDGTCTIKVDGLIVDSDTGSEAKCFWEKAS